MSLVPAMALHLYDDEGEEAPKPIVVVRNGHCKHCGKLVGKKLFLKAHEAICEARK